MMRLTEVLPIIQVLSNPVAKLHADHHICSLDYEAPSPCPLSPSAIYTQLEALNDTAAALIEISLGCGTVATVGKPMESITCRDCWKR
jgi:hypothetical protein